MMKMKKDDKVLILIGNCVSGAMRWQFAQGDNVTVIPASMSQFQSGEPFVEPFYKKEAEFEQNAALLKGKNAIIVQSAGIPVSENGLHLLMMAHTLKAYGVKSVTAAMPFAPFLRQDRKFNRRFVSLGAAFFASQLKSAGIDKVVTVTPHSKDSISEYQKVFGGNFKALTATELFVADLKKKYGGGNRDIRFGAPDGGDKPADEGMRRAREAARAYFGPEMGEKELDTYIFKISKRHTGVNTTEIHGFEGDVEGKTCVMFDDMVDGGGTLVNGGRCLKDKGAKSVAFYGTHGILSGNALDKIFGAKTDSGADAIDRFVITDSIPDAAQKLAAYPAAAGRAEVLTVAQLVFAESVALAAQPAPGRLTKAFASALETGTAAVQAVLDFTHIRRNSR